MNKIVLIGRLTKNAELRSTATGKIVCQFTIAVDRPFKHEDGKKEADFIPVVIWGNAAEFIGQNAGKGNRVAVEGRLQIRSYEDKEGRKVWVSEVVASNVELIDWKSKEESSGFDSMGESFTEEIPF